MMVVFFSPFFGLWIPRENLTDSRSVKTKITFLDAFKVENIKKQLWELKRLNNLTTHDGIGETV